MGGREVEGQRVEGWRALTLTTALTPPPCILGECDAAAETCGAGRFAFEFAFEFAFAFEFEFEFAFE